MTKLFVGSLPFAVTSQQLGDLFAQYGKILSADVVMDKFTGRSRGFGFVEMENDAAAQKAIQELNNSEFDGRKIFVSVARPKEARSESGSSYQRRFDHHRK